MQEMGFIKQNKTSNKNYPVGKKQDSLQCRAGQGKAGQEQETFGNKLAQDCKHKEIIKGAN